MMVLCVCWPPQSELAVLQVDDPQLKVSLATPFHHLMPVLCMQARLHHKDCISERSTRPCILQASAVIYVSVVTGAGG